MTGRTKDLILITSPSRRSIWRDIRELLLDLRHVFYPDNPADEKIVTSVSLQVCPDEAADGKIVRFISSVVTSPSWCGSWRKTRKQFYKCRHKPVMTCFLTRKQRSLTNTKKLTSFSHGFKHQTKYNIFFIELGKPKPNIVEACCIKLLLRLSNKVHVSVSFFIIKVPPHEACTVCLWGSVKPS